MPTQSRGHGTRRRAWHPPPGERRGGRTVCGAVRKPEALLAAGRRRTGEHPMTEFRGDYW
jgi:hypothetical protein